MGMTLSGYTIDTIDIRLTSAITTAAGSLGDRSGLRLRLTTPETTGVGETAPVPGAPRSLSLEEIAAAVREWADDAVGTPIDELLGGLDDRRLHPLPRFAVHTALADLAARERAVPLRQWLRAGSTDLVRTNALIIDESPKGVHAAVKQAVADGVTAVKLKVGAEDTGLDATRIIAASEAGGTITALRLDANRGWTLEQTIRVVGRVGPYRIDYIEDPTADQSEYATVTAETGVAVAVDATTDQSDRLDRVLADTGASVLVVKAAAVGGVDRIVDAARTLDEGQRLVVSSSLDGPIGLLAGLQAAAALPADDLAHGLATGSLIRGMPDWLIPSGGVVRLGHEPGLSAIDE